MTNATPTGSVCPLRRPPKGKDHPSASRTAFFGLPPDSRNPSSPQPSRLLDSPHHHADVGLADEKSGLAQASAQASAREGRAVGTDWRPGVRFGNTSRRSPRRDLLATLSTDRARPRQAAGAICAGGPQPTAPPVSVTGASRGPIPRLTARRLNFPDRDFSPAWPQVQRVARYSSDWPLIPIYPDS